MRNFLHVIITSDLFRLSLFTLHSLKETNYYTALGAYIGSMLYVVLALSFVSKICKNLFSIDVAKIVTIISGIALVIWPGGITCVISLVLGVYGTALFFIGLISSIINGGGVIEDDTSSLDEHEMLKWGIFNGYLRINRDSPYVSFTRDSNGRVIEACIFDKHYYAQDLGNGQYRIGDWQYDDSD